MLLPKLFIFSINFVSFFRFLLKFVSFDFSGTTSGYESRVSQWNRTSSLPTKYSSKCSVNLFLRPLFSLHSHSRHYALCCLTSITFTSQDNDLANKLIKIYFALFRVRGHQQWTRDWLIICRFSYSVWKKMSVRNFLQFFSAVLREPYPMHKVFSICWHEYWTVVSLLVDLENILEHLNDLFRIVHSTNFKTSVRALQLLFRIAEQR